MPMGRADLEQIGSYVKDHLNDWLTEVATPLAMGPQLMERIARVDERIVDVDERLLRLDERVAGLNDRMLVVQEELKYQREFMGTRFHGSPASMLEEERISRAPAQAADKRFEDMQAYLDKRFGAVDKRFEDMHTSMNTRFAAVDKRFEQMQANTDKRFEDLITNMNKRFAETRWLMGGVVVMLATMMSLYQFLG